MQEIERKIMETVSLMETELACRLEAAYAGDTVLADAMRYAVLGGGKRIRAFLTLSFCRLFGGQEQAAIPYACAIEMVHAYSLVHDDMPCMDNDAFRRGKPSCHKAYGEANALLAGDALLTLAFDVAAEPTVLSDRSVRLAVTELATGAGAVGMAGGQYYDLAHECADFDALRRLQNMKTGALIRSAALMGYYAAVDSPRAEVVADITQYAAGIGFAFQVVDDLLDVQGDAAVLGKPIGSDEKNDKKTVLSFLSVSEARKLAESETERAVQSIEKYPGSETLCALAMYLLNRKK